MIYFFIFAVSLIIAYLMTPDIRYIALKTSAIDKKNHRKIHKKVVAQLGGLAIYFGILGGLATIAMLDPSFFKENMSTTGGFVVCATLILLLGVYDDFQGSGAFLKFTVEIIVALLLIRIGFRLERINIPGLADINLGILTLPATVLWLVGITNAINLIDGLDGLATGIIGIASIFLCLCGILFKENFIVFTSLAVIGASLGFLKYNFYPAKIFLGDTGSLFLGFTISSLGIYRSNPGNTANLFFLPVVVVLAMPIIDTVAAIVRRTIRGRHIFQGDFSHIHHYCIKQGLTQVQVVTGFYLVTFCLGAISLLIIYACLS